MGKITLSQDEITSLVERLKRLTGNLWWTWNQDCQDIFQDLSPRAWQNLYHNAVAVLHEVSDYELRVRLQDPRFAAQVRAALRSFEAYLSETDTWGRRHAPALLDNPVAYFTAEFGFHETLPIAAGGLGILAGDQARSASDLGIGFVIFHDQLDRPAEHAFVLEFIHGHLHTQALGHAMVGVIAAGRTHHSDLERFSRRRSPRDEGQAGAQQGRPNGCPLQERPSAYFLAQFLFHDDLLPGTFFCVPPILLHLEGTPFRQFSAFRAPPQKGATCRVSK
jgi:hypothetical protein